MRKEINSLLDEKFGPIPYDFQIVIGPVSLEERTCIIDLIPPTHQNFFFLPNIPNVTLELDFKGSYPFAPFKTILKTELYHPKFHELGMDLGHACSSCNKWSPTFRVRPQLDKIIYLLVNPVYYGSGNDFKGPRKLYNEDKMEFVEEIIRRGGYIDVSHEMKRAYQSHLLWIQSSLKLPRKGLDPSQQQYLKHTTAKESLIFKSWLTFGASENYFEIPYHPELTLKSVKSLLSKQLDSDIITIQKMKPQEKYYRDQTEYNQTLAELKIEAGEEMKFVSSMKCECGCGVYGDLAVCIDIHIILSMSILYIM